MYLTNRNRRVMYIYNGKSVTKVYYDRPRSIPFEVYEVDKFVTIIF